MLGGLCVFILSHGRPDNVTTLRTLTSHGYTGPVFIVIDDEDKTADRYRENFGDKVVQFSKGEIAPGIDTGDNFPERNTVLFARNACFDIARRLGFRYFVQLDDDYGGFYQRFDPQGLYGVWKLEPLDSVFPALARFLAATPFATVAISQGGDHIGGGAANGNKKIGAKRKAMNLFVCDTERPFPFIARMNDDVTTCTALQRAGLPFITIGAAQLNQAETQSRPGGLTEMYLQHGTYVKSFYSVMFCPSGVKVSTLGDNRVEGAGYRRIHHQVNWNAVAPCIIRESARKAA